MNTEKTTEKTTESAREATKDLFEGMISLGQAMLIPRGNEGDSEIQDRLGKEIQRGLRFLQERDRDPFEIVRILGAVTAIAANSGIRLLDLSSSLREDAMKEILEAEGGGLE